LPPQLLQLFFLCEARTQSCFLDDKQTNGIVIINNQYETSR
jgi:hypothetical protein